MRFHDGLDIIEYMSNNETTNTSMFQPNENLRTLWMMDVADGIEASYDYADWLNEEIVNCDGLGVQLDDLIDELEAFEAFKANRA